MDFYIVKLHKSASSQACPFKTIFDMIKEILEYG